MGGDDYVINEHGSWSDRSQALHWYVSEVNQLREAARGWTLVYAGLECDSVQVFRTFEADPQKAALSLDAEHPWLSQGFHLVAAIAGQASVLPMDDARRAERGLHGWPPTVPR